ncbi:helix-turn-helix transcriptional regulator [Roseateles sp. BYS96W]|uniref:Helix-turn-helix transcriptional regulator n=1 Tax=Pelomonas nitida TaxID=3299027 RepID=A0ABW7G8W7_9BURK
MTAPFKPLHRQDIADLLDVSLRTVDNWVQEGRIPAPKHLGRGVLWHPDCFYGWLDQYLKATGPEPMSDRASMSAPVEPADAPHIDVVEAGLLKSSGPRRRATKEAQSIVERELAKLQAQAQASIALEEA